MLNLQNILLKDNSGIFFNLNLLNLYIYILSEARFENDGVTFFKKKKKVYEYFCSFIFWEMHEKYHSHVFLLNLELQLTAG